MIPPCSKRQAGSVRAGGLLGLDEILNAALPDVHASGSSTSVKRRDPDREAHPTEVKRWESFPADVRECLQWPEVQVMPAGSSLERHGLMPPLSLQRVLAGASIRFHMQGWRAKTHAFQIDTYDSSHFVNNEVEAVSMMRHTANKRLNSIFMVNDFEYRFMAGPSSLQPDSQVCYRLHNTSTHASLRKGGVEEMPVCLQVVDPDMPEQEIHGDFPDICLQEQKGIGLDVLRMAFKKK